MMANIPSIWTIEPVGLGCVPGWLGGGAMASRAAKECNIISIVELERANLGMRRGLASFTLARKPACVSRHPYHLTPSVCENAGASGKMRPLSPGAVYPCTGKGLSDLGERVFDPGEGFLRARRTLSPTPERGLPDLGERCVRRRRTLRPTSESAFSTPERGPSEHGEGCLPRLETAGLAGKRGVWGRAAGRAGRARVPGIKARRFSTRHLGRRKVPAMKTSLATELKPKTGWGKTTDRKSVV